MQIHKPQLTILFVLATLIFNTFVVTTLLAAPLIFSASAAEKAPLPFDQFLKSVANARYDDYRKLPDARVESEAEFDRMKQHILNLYKGRKAVKTIVSNGSCFDCLPLPAHVASPPPDMPAPPQINGKRVKGSLRGTALPAEVIGPTGPLGTPLPAELSSVAGPPGTVPVMRVTLEQIVRFPKLQYFFSKDGSGGGGVPLPP